MASEIPDLVVDAARHGVTMKLDGGKLLLRADTPPPAALLDRIRENTAALIRHLEFASGSGGEPSDPAEVFADNVRKSLRVHSEILDHPFDPEDFRMARIKSDTATAVLSVASRGSPDQLRIKQDGNRTEAAIKTTRRRAPAAKTAAAEATAVKTAAHVAAAEAAAHVAAAETTAMAAAECQRRTACGHRRAQRGRGQQYTEAFHIIFLPEGRLARRRLMNNSSIVRLHREVIVLSGAESCFLNNLAI